MNIMTVAAQIYMYSKTMWDIIFYRCMSQVHSHDERQMQNDLIKERRYFYIHCPAVYRQNDGTLFVLHTHESCNWHAIEAVMQEAGTKAISIKLQLVAFVKADGKGT